MGRKIVVYGNPDKSNLGFPMPGDIRQYIEHDVFAIEHGRYRYTQGMDADVIVLSRDGLAYGHFDIASKERPTDDDRRSYPRVRYVYLVRRSTLYEHPVALSPLGITKFRFGRLLSEEEFGKIRDRAGQTQDFVDIAIAEELPGVAYREGTATRIIVNAYERNTEAVLACRAHYGTRCQVCDVDLGERYGDIGQ